MLGSPVTTEDPTGTADTAARRPAPRPPGDEGPAVPCGVAGHSSAQVQALTGKGTVLGARAFRQLLDMVPPRIVAPDRAKVA